jgi:hypothetical protein
MAAAADELERLRLEVHGLQVEVRRCGPARLVARLPASLAARRAFQPCRPAPARPRPCWAG